MTLTPAVRTWTFYLGFGVVCAMIVRHGFALFLPDRLATEIGHNGESFLFAIIVCATIQWFRPWAARQRHERWIVAAYGLALYAFGWWLLKSGLPNDYATFNESFFGAGMVALYVQPKRPLRYGPWLAAVVLAVIVVFFKTEFVLVQSEDLVMIMLAPLGFDVFDRTILDRSAIDQPARRLGWCVALLVTWFVFWRLSTLVRPDLSGPVDYSIDYAYRAAEAYWGILFVHLYFSYWLGRAWRGRQEEPEVTQVEAGLT